MGDGSTGGEDDWEHSRFKASWRCAHAGDQHSLGRICELIRNEVSSHAKLIRSKCLESDDVAQEVIVVVLPLIEAGGFPAHTSPRGWVRGIMLNKMRDLARHGFDRRSERTAEDLAGTYFAPEINMAAKEEGDARQDCLDRLGSTEKQLLIDRYTIGLSVRAMAARHDVTHPTIGKWLAKALNSVRDCMKRKGFHE